MKYDKSFYENRHDNTIHSARTVLGFIYKFYKFKSAIDFGCGIGTWLSASKELGCDSIKGLDGDWVPREFLKVDKNEFQEFNFEKNFNDTKKFDLAISLEVAEHISGNNAETFVANLCATAPLVLFGAAVPFQGGNGHVNEQWQSYWQELFKAKGYIPLDIIRPAVWNDPSIPFWYKQNTILYYNPLEIDLSQAAADFPNFYGMNLVHPSLYKIKANPSMIERYKLLISIPRYIKTRLALNSHPK